MQRRKGEIMPSNTPLSPSHPHSLSFFLRAKVDLDMADAEFESVQQCHKDATACEKMEMAVRNYTLANEWRKVRNKLEDRLTDHHCRI